MKARMAANHSALKETQMRHIELADEHNKLKATYQRLLQTHTEKIRNHKTQFMTLAAAHEEAEGQLKALTVKHTDSTLRAKVATEETVRLRELLTLETAELEAAQKVLASTNEELEKSRVTCGQLEEVVAKLEISHQQSALSHEQAQIWRERYEVANGEQGKLR